jgi:hypothetical protein
MPCSRASRRAAGITCTSRAIVIRMILGPPGQRAQLAAEPYRYAVSIVDFVLAGSLTSPAGTNSLPLR